MFSSLYLGDPCDPTKVAIPRIKVKKKPKKPRKPYVRKKSVIKASKKSSDAIVADANVNENETLFSDDPLTNNEEMEIIEETIKEDTEQTEKIALTKEKGCNIIIEDGKKKLDGSGKKKSKSSYSIAALCQISVNIGDNRPEVANSPGMMSLNSVGTISPANTPGPNEKTFPLETCIVIDNTANVEETVIEELRTIRPEDLQQIEVASTIVSTSQLSTVTTSACVQVTSLPTSVSSEVVTKQAIVETVESKNIQKDIYQAIEDLDQELGLEKNSTEKSNSPVKESLVTKECLLTKLSGPVTTASSVSSKTSTSAKPITSSSTTTTISVSSPSSVTSVTSVSHSTKTVTSSAAALSVYDFQASKPETPPIPLQERRKDSKLSKPSAPTVVDPSKMSSSPEKKRYTELHSKSKKTTGDDVSRKYPDTRKVTTNITDHQMSVGSGHAHHVNTPYAQTNFNLTDPSYQQHPNMQRQRLPSNYSQLPPTTNSQYPVTCRQSSYMSYPYQGTSAGQHTQHQHSYHHPYNQHDSTHHGHSSKYPCSSSHANYPHSDFHPRSYYPGHHSSYRSFHNELSAGDGLNVYNPSDRKRANIAMESLHQPSVTQHSPEKLISSTSGTFSVTHLVNSNQRKASKRSTSSSNKVSKQTKVENVKESKTEKEDFRKSCRSQSTRRNKSGTRSNYSAESLISGAGASAPTMASAIEQESKSKLTSNTSPSKNASPKVNPTDGKIFSNSVKSSSNWSNDMNYFSGLQLSSLSPSPASIIPTDLSSIDFPMSIFGQQENNLTGKEYLTASSSSGGNSSQKTGSSSKQQSGACQLQQRTSSVTAVTDWTLNQALIDNNFLIPGPTLTPPNDPMSDPMSSYSFMSPMTHSHTSGWYPCTASGQSSSRSQHQASGYSAHSAANIPVSGYSQTKPSSSSAGQHSVSAVPHSTQMPLPPITAPTQSFINFNLSTIFPEINTPGAGQNNCHGRSELLPPPIALLGHTSQSMSASFSVPPNMAPPTLPFTNNPEL